jgi:hypothetical protein
MFIWQYDTSGDWSLRESQEAMLALQDSETLATVNIPQLQSTEAYKYLGVHIAMDGNMHSQEKSLTEKCAKYITIFSQCQMTLSNMQMIYRTVFGPAVKYVLPATTLSDKFLTDVQKPIVVLALSKMGFNQHMPRAVVMAPLHFGGLGLFDLVVEQGLSQVVFILAHIRSSSPAAQTIFVLLEHT